MLAGSCAPIRSLCARDGPDLRDRMVIRRPYRLATRRGRACRERHVCRTGLRRCGVVPEVWREMLSSGYRGVPGTALVWLRVRCRYCSDEPEGELT